MTAPSILSLFFHNDDDDDDDDTAGCCGGGDEDDEVVGEEEKPRTIFQPVSFSTVSLILYRVSGTSSGRDCRSKEVHEQPKKSLALSQKCLYLRDRREMENERDRFLVVGGHPTQRPTKTQLLKY